jgi:hypothetical protein
MLRVASLACALGLAIGAAMAAYHPPAYDVIKDAEAGRWAKNWRQLWPKMNAMIARDGGIRVPLGFPPDCSAACIWGHIDRNPQYGHVRGNLSGAEKVGREIR